MKWNLMKTGFVLAWAALATTGNPANASTLTATGQGSCNALLCYNTNTSVIADTFVGLSFGDVYRDWFAFNLNNFPNVSVLGATINIWNYGGPSPDPDTFNLYAASSISYSGLVNGGSLGSINVGVANSEVPGYVSITLNSTAVALLNASKQSGANLFIFGGATDATDGGAFGGFPATPIAAQLILETVPLPATLPLFGSGLVGLSLLTWRRKKKKRHSQPRE